MHSDLFALHAQLEQRHWWFEARADIVGAVVDALAGEAATDIVDIGCGTGGVVRRLSRSHRVTGFDTSPEAVRLAQAAGGPHSNVHQVAGIDEMRSTIGAAQVVLLMDVLEHVRDDFLLLSQIVTAMTPGAFLVVTVPADPELWSAHDVAFQHFRRYTEHRLRATWSGLPIDARLIAPLNHRLAPAIRAVRSTRRQGDQSDLSLPSTPVNALLRFIFAGERHRIVRALARGDRSSPGAGVSWLAVVRREAGEAPVRTRPGGIAPDLHDPEASHRAT